MHVEIKNKRRANKLTKTWHIWDLYAYGRPMGRLYRFKDIGWDVICFVSGHQKVFDDYAYDGKDNAKSAAIQWFTAQVLSSNPQEQ